MVKFSKQLDGQLVPEWRPAYCNYWQLKKDLKQIKLRKKQSGNEAAATIAAPSDSPLRTFSGLTRRRFMTSAQNQVIRVHQRTLSEPPEDFYETEVVGPTPPTEEEKVFFSRLDGQLNNVNRFYRRKESEYCKRAEALSRQMSLLIETKHSHDIISG